MAVSIRALLAATLISALGCATAPAPISDEVRAAIRTVSLARPAVVPKFPMVVGPSASTAHFLIGPIGLMASMHSENPDSQALGKLMAEHRVDIGEIARAEFAAHLATKGVEIAEEGGDAVFEIVIESYGLGPAFSMRPINAPLRPTLAVSVKLSARDGAVLWQKRAFITAMNGEIEARKFDEILADAARVQRDFAKAAQIVAKELLQDVGGFGPAPTQTAAAAAAPVSAPSPPHTGPLPAPGTTWVYGFADRMYRGRQSEITVRVLRADGTVIEEAIATNAQDAKAATRVMEAREPRFLEHSLGGNAALIEIAPYLLAAHDGKGMPRGLQATGYPQGTLAPWVASIEQKDWERITVPAGTFQALRVEIVGERAHHVFTRGETGRFSITVWYAPEVKRFVRLEHKAWSAESFTSRGGKQIGDDLIELLAYRPPS